MFTRHFELGVLSREKKKKFSKTIKEELLEMRSTVFPLINRQRPVKFFIKVSTFHLATLITFD